MFTPQRRPLPAITLTPRAEPRKTGAALNASSSKTDGVWKGKAVAFLDGPAPPPPPPRGDNGASLETENIEDWRKFREAGLLDEATLERKDREALLEKASRLEKELFDYQHNMGLLLMEKRDWSLTYEELGQAVEEAREILKREQSSHLIALSEADKRVENLRNALGVEKRCIADLEKAIRDLREDRVRLELDSERKSVEAEALAGGIKEKALEVEQKLHDVDAKLDEINRRSSELDKKLQDLDARESAVQRERLALSAEREAHKMAFYKRREELNEWERKLQKEEEREGELQRTLNQRQDKANQTDRIFEQKQKELEEVEKRMDLSLKTLNKREDDVNTRMLELLAKEKQADSDGRILEMKDKELLALEDKLHAREKLEIQTIIDEQKAVLDSKMHEFDLELREKRKNLDDELRNKAGAVKQLEVENLHREEKLRKQEQALNAKSERVKEKEKDLDSKLKSIKEKEKFMKAEQRKIDLEKKELLADKECFSILKDECEKIRIEIGEQKMQIDEEFEKLKVVNDEKIEHLRLQAELNQELDRCRGQQDFLLRESEDLKQERQKFEKEWEVLEEKRAQITEELKKVVDERDNLQTLQYAEEERLKKLKHETQQNIQRDLEAVRLEKESFEAQMKYEQSALHERVRVEHDQMVQDFESQRYQLETELMSRQEELERGLQEREKAFEKQKEMELNDINNSKDTVQRELQEIQLQRLAMEKEKQELASNKEKLKTQQFEIQKDINELEILSKSLRGQREQAINERNHFIAFVEKCKNCKNCGEITRDFVLSNLQTPDGEDTLTLPLPKLSDKHVRSNQGVDASNVMNIDGSPGELEKGYMSQGRMSWLQKCTSKIFSLSPSKMVEHNSKVVSPGPSSALPVNMEAQTEGNSMFVTDEVKNSADPRYGPRPSSRTAEDSIDSRQFQSDENRDGDIEYSASVDHSHMDSMLQDDAEDAEQSKLKSSRRKPERRQKTRISRTRSVKAVVEDAKLFLGESPEIGESQGVLDHPEEAVTISRKRQSVPAETEQATADSEGPSDSVPAGGRRKRRQEVSSATKAPGQQRYNLRRQKNVGTAPASRTSSDLLKPEEKNGNQPRLEHETSVQSLGDPSEIGKSTHLVHVTTVKAVEISEERVVKFKTTEVDGQADETKPAEAMEMNVDVSGTQEYEDEEENGSTIPEEDDDEEDDDDEDWDWEHPGEVSLGKKLWSFFTT